MRLRLLALATLLLALSGGAIATAEAGARIRRCNRSEDLCSRRFNQVVLAGTHNSMSSESLGWRIPNQSVGIPRQLTGGVRALLIDTHYGRLQENGRVVTDDDGTVSEGRRGIYLCHAYCEIGATKLAPALRSIRHFLRQHPNNVLLIENEDYIRSDDFVRAMEQSGLLDYVYMGQARPKWPTLRRMIKRRQQVVMLADREASGDPGWYHATFEGVLQETPYMFDPPEELIDPANWPASCQPNRGGTSGSLFLMNHWSPPRPPQEPDLEQSAAVNAKDVIVGRALECAELRGRLPSVIAVDQFTAGGVLRAVKELNRIWGRR